MEYPDKLLALAGSFTPAFSPRAEDWMPIEGFIGIEFSPDYKALVGQFGFGRFGRGLELATPNAPPSRRLSVENLNEFATIAHRVENRMGVRFFPHPNGLMCVGSTGTRISVCLRPPLKHDPAWNLAVCDFDSYRHFEFQMPISEFIFKLYQRELRSTWLDQFREYLWPDSVALFKPFGSIIPSN